MMRSSDSLVGGGGGAVWRVGGATLRRHSTDGRCVSTMPDNVWEWVELRKGWQHDEACSQ